MFLPALLDNFCTENREQKVPKKIFSQLNFSLVKKYLSVNHSKSNLILSKYSQDVLRDRG